jgi:hypothetical protein
MFQTVLGILFICYSIYQIYIYLKGRPVFITNSTLLLVLLAVVGSNLYIDKVMDGEVYTVGAMGLLFYILSSAVIAILERVNVDKEERDERNNRNSAN